MHSTMRMRGVASFLLAGALIPALAACSTPAATPAGEPVAISFLVDEGATAEGADALAAKFNELNPGTTVAVVTRPSGTDGDNLIKTRLATGEMEEVFLYNSGALLGALNPDQTLVNLADEGWVSTLTDDFKSVVSTDAGLYGAPIGTSQAGGVLYNRKVYQELGLQVPTSWADFLANSEKVKAAGLIPVIQSYGATFSSQLFVLSDFANVLSADPQWADEFTAHKRTFTESPGLDAFAHHREAFDKGLFNKDFASASLDDGVRMLATGEGAHYPMLTGVLPSIAQNFPDQVDDLGYFAMPATAAANTRATIWEPSALYIPKSAEGAKLEAARKFIAFVNSEDGCAIQNAKFTPYGPYVTSTCKLPDSVASMLNDLQAYLDRGEAAPALEFLSPVKGPNLEKILVEVGSGIITAEEGAAQYDRDVEAQAQQLGLPGW